MSWMGYHRERVDDLRRRIGVAVAELAGVHSDDPAAAEAIATVRRAQSHLEKDCLPLLDRIRASEAITAPIGFRPGDIGDLGVGFDGEGRSWFDDRSGAVFGDEPAAGRRGVISSVVAGMTTEEREFFQGFVDASAGTVASELSHYDAFPEYYSIDSLPPELARLDDRREWDRLAHLYLIETYHDMVDTGEVTLQRSGEHYWIDPVDLGNANGSVLGAEAIIGMAVGGAGGIGRGRGIPPSVGRTATSPMPPPRTMIAPTSITGYTRHGLERVMNRDGVGVSPVAMRDAVRNPIRVQPSSTGTFQFVGTDATVVLNGQGLVVTAWATSRSGWRGAR